MLNEIKDKTSKAVNDIIKSGENLLQYGANEIKTVTDKLIINGNEQDQEKIETVTNCPYLEEKCSDIDCPCPKYNAYKMMLEPGMIERKISELGIDPNQDSWTVMMAMQKIFAGRFMSTENRTKEEIDHWVNDYLVCIADELAEFATSNGSKEELQKEVIDIAHFVMDVFIAGEYTADEIKNRYIEIFTPNVIGVKNFLTYAYEMQQAEPEPDNSWKSYYITSMLIASAKVRQQISWKHWKKPNASINREKLLDANVYLFKAFMNLVVRTMTVDELKDIYIKKNVENILRQELDY